MMDVIEHDDQFVFDGFRQFIKEQVGQLIEPGGTAGTEQVERTMTKVRRDLLNSSHKILKKDGYVSIG